MTATPPPKPLSLAAYRAAAGLIAPLAGPVLRARARRGKEDPARLSERLGYASIPRPPGPLAWLHAVSVGESLSLLPLIAALRSERPDLALLVTSGTQASADILARRLPQGVLHQYAPVDTPGAVDRFLAHWRPGTGLFAESELWPNLILAARHAGVRLALVSARMTERSAKAWAARPAAASAVLRSFEAVLSQDAATEARLARLGAPIAGRLNLKRLGDPLPCDAAELERLRAEIADRRVLVAASTHAGEEQIVARAAASLEPAPLLVIVPRHPERGGDIAGSLAGRAIARRSVGEPIGPETEICLADTLGEVGLMLRLAQLAIVGGGFIEGVGGHNPLEPARLGVGAISGPHVFNFADIYREMAAAGGARVVENEAALVETLADLWRSPERVAAMGEAALAYARRQGAELAAALALIRPLLPAA
ncbi:MAG TPA: 3-deoxy-D-manno-octulosonic acid transferase [Caulobacteraceae bacterium]|nr:3-deoxy-D-manno-octulosonic acid transferase [Caulobacteraceae bacterium]